MREGSPAQTPETERRGQMVNFRAFGPVNTDWTQELHTVRLVYVMDPATGRHKTAPAQGS